MRIDYIIISHFDLDHVGGILTIMDKLKVENIIISKQGEDSENYRKFKEIVEGKKIKVSILSSNTKKIDIEDKIYFDILWPNSAKLIMENVLNNNSIVCKINYKNFSLLFTGDIEEIAEKQILQQYKSDLQILTCTVLKVGHHGSKSSSSSSFIEAVKPKFALIGVGENNKFGHPNNEVINRLEKIGCKIYRTDLMGQITINVNNNGNVNVKRKTVCSINVEVSIVYARLRVEENIARHAPKVYHK